ncbi:AlbA family DNA-binding domain-containing protein [Paraburkholderia azotifigens]|uniref:ATP-binding protein n=1 Tax=Paraburkholderia azotifigens TaxID=2057004 RepID=A0A5C6VIH1_9BURK|nr:ATP-binding protein [Paraburkholderia azotifigens]TXC84494.1 ATP-binding protein [Paraburkholderia azotifigens]
MIPFARLEETDETVVRQLIDDEIRESRTLDYKVQLDLSKDGRQALAEDVCAFANTVGGDLVFGIREADGVADEVVPVILPNLDDELLKLTNSLRDAIEPRVSGGLLHQAVPLAAGGHVVVLRVAMSPNAPHRVRRNNHFYLRHSGGKETMDIHAIRTAFAFAGSLADRALAWRDQRLAVLRERIAPLLLERGPLFVVHLLPLAALTRRESIALDSLKAAANELQWAKPAGHPLRPPVVNYEGVICPPRIDGAAPGPGFAQLFHDGSIELAGAVTARQLGKPAISVLAPAQYELPLVEHSLPAIVRAIAALDVPPPAYLFVTLLEVAGQRVGFQRPDGQWPETPVIPGHLRELRAAPVYIEDFRTPPLELARAAVAPLWHAIGEEQTQTNFGGNAA